MPPPKVPVKNPSMPIRVLIADDDEFVLAGLRAALKSIAEQGIADVSVVDEARVFSELVKKAEKHQPEVVLMEALTEIPMPDPKGMKEATARITGQFRQIRLMAVCGKVAAGTARGANTVHMVNSI